MACSGIYSSAFPGNRVLLGLLTAAPDRARPRSWGRLTEALRSGKAQFGGAEGHYNDLYSNPADAESFAAAMSAGSLLAAQALATQFP